MKYDQPQFVERKTIYSVSRKDGKPIYMGDSSIQIVVSEEEMGDFRRMLEGDMLMFEPKRQIFAKKRSSVARMVADYKWDTGETEGEKNRTALRKKCAKMDWDTLRAEVHKIEARMAKEFEYSRCILEAAEPAEPTGSQQRQMELFVAD